mgnify:FL=1
MAKWIVCPECKGEGSHMTPSLRNEAFTREDFDADPDFEEGYFGGRYDVTCTLCKGARVVDGSPEAEADRTADREYAAEVAAEQRYFGGGY